MKITKATHLRQWIEANRPAVIDEPAYAAIREALAPVSESYLRKLVRDCGSPLAPMVAGVRQRNLDELESSLLALLDEYESGDAQRKQQIRRMIIDAKDRARWHAPKSPEDASNRQEVVSWMLTWLENPPLFRDWIKIRRGLLHK